MSLVSGLMFGIAAFVGAYQMSKNDKNIWVSMGKSLFISIHLYSMNILQFMKRNKDHMIDQICYICRHLWITDCSNGSEIFEFVEDDASWTHGRSKAGIFYLAICCLCIIYEVLI